MPGRFILHITLDTGDMRRSPRGEVSDVAIATVQSGLGIALAGGESAIPATRCTMTAAGEGRCLIATVWRPDAEGRAPLVTVGIAAHSRCGARLWRALHDPAGRMPPQLSLATDPDDFPPEPWLAARLEIGLALYPEEARWLGDWERVLAWAWLSRVEARR